MSDRNGSYDADASGLRERLPQKPDAPQKAESAETAQDAVKKLNDQEAKAEKDEKDKRTFGRTPDGTGAYDNKHLTERSRVATYTKEGLKLPEVTPTVSSCFVRPPISTKLMFVTI